MSVSVPIVGPVRGRGARSNHTGRFEPGVREDFDDGWTADGPPVACAAVARPVAPRLDDTLTPLRSRTIITRNDSPDIAFEQSINPYVGCSHGCIYCYARPAHAYMGLSPGLDFETKLFFKPDAARLLERELSRPGYRPSTIHIGGNTDPYQPAERTLKITRSVLEMLQRFAHPFTIITKSALIGRDADILGDMGARGLARAFVSVTTLDRSLARAMEPRAATPLRRIETIGVLVGAGVPTGVLFAPTIPGLNDHEMEAVLERGAQAGATTAAFVVLRLPLEIKDLFYDWLDAERPDRARRVRSLIRQVRGGRDYDPGWAHRMKGTGPIAQLLSQRFRLACGRLNLQARRDALRTDLFKVPPKPGDQMTLFV